MHVYGMHAQVVLFAWPPLSWGAVYAMLNADEMLTTVAAASTPPFAAGNATTLGAAPRPPAALAALRLTICLLGAMHFSMPRSLRWRLATGTYLNGSGLLSSCVVSYLKMGDPGVLLPQTLGNRVLPFIVGFCCAPLGRALTARRGRRGGHEQQEGLEAPLLKGGQ